MKHGKMSRVYVNAGWGGGLCRINQDDAERKVSCADLHEDMVVSQ